MTRGRDRPHRASTRRLRLLSRCTPALGAIRVPPIEIRREHRVPLSTRALEVLAEAQKLDDGSGLLFPPPTGKAPANMTTSKLLNGLGIGATMHWASYFVPLMARRVRRIGRVGRGRARAWCRGYRSALDRSMGRDRQGREAQPQSRRDPRRTPLSPQRPGKGDGREHMFASPVPGSRCGRGHLLSSGRWR